ncbi:HEAT repeat-containing protein 5A [Orchesella cincta]|uniref:HEAT repeat-containing protein 5A n=1 Tax=Orchesella cincta TaxID=48709 RepID=A0A1D2M825_ORCCI|nr:HEAT repeat-containing protein 5A [Orchesella cincta]
MAVRTSAAKCILQMMQSAPFLYTTELESLTSLCFRALDGADYDGRIAIAKLLGIAVSYTQRPPTPGGGKGKGIMITSSSSSSKNSSAKPVSLEECLSILMTGFLRGATSFLKGEIIKGSSGVNREVRVGVTHAYVSFIEQWALPLEKNLEQFTNHVLELVANPKPLPAT